MNSLKWRIVISITGIVAISLVITTVFIQHRAKKALSDEIERNAFNLLDATTKHVESQYKSIVYHKSTMLERRKEELKNNTTIVFSMVENIYNQYKAGHFSEHIAKKRVLTFLKSLRYGKGVGYFWINDTGTPYPKMIMHPTIPNLDGRVLDDPEFNCALGKSENLFKAFVDVTEKTNEGYVDYLWPKPSPLGLTKQQPKISYVKRFKPWNWVIGTGVYIDDIEKDVQDRIDAVIDDLNDSLKTQKIGRSGYFYIVDEDNRVLVHPNIVNSDLSNAIEPLTGKLLVQLIKKAAFSQQNSLEYMWDKPGREGIYNYRKIAYVSYFQPLGWYIVSSTYIDDLEYKINELSNAIILFFSFFSALALLLSLLMSKSISKPLNTLIQAISKTDKDGIPIEEIPKASTGEINLLGTTIRNMIDSISESRKIIEQSESKFRGLIESSTDLVWEVNKKGFYEYVSPQIFTMLGYKPEEMVGKYVFDFMPPAESEKISHIFQEAVKNGDVINALENINMHKDGTEVVIETNGIPFYDSEGELVGYRGVARDITKRKEDEKELKKRSLELADANNELTLHKQHLLELVDERTKELNQSLENLKKTQNYLVQTEKMAALGGLVAGVAHEINTPVGICVTAASYLDDKTREFSNKVNANIATKEDHYKYFDVVQESTAILLSNMEKAASLIQSFKQVAVDQSYEELREFKINKYIDEILLSIHSKFKKTPFVINVVCPEDFLVYSYPGALSQVLTNLLMNSLLHGFEGKSEGTITIEANKYDSIAIIRYKDDGNGISEENLKRIYDPFFTTRRGKGGSGLGMQIVYNLVTQTLKGNIHCISREGEGVMFELEFPIGLHSEDFKNL